MNQGGNNGSYPERPVVAVGAAVFKDGKVLLVKRGNPPSEGVWAIPGGRVKLGETLKEAAEREIMEECGIVIRAGEPVFSFESIRHDPGGGIRFHYVIIDLAADYVGGVPSAGDDALDARWVAPDELPDMNVIEITRDFLKRSFGFGQ